MIPLLNFTLNVFQSLFFNAEMPINPILEILLHGIVLLLKPEKCGCILSSSKYAGRLEEFVRLEDPW